MIRAAHLAPSSAPSRAYPDACAPLEEAAAADPSDAAPALAFAFARLLAAPAARPLLLVTTLAWIQERGRPFARGFALQGVAPERLVWIAARTDAEALWALEEGLKSGAVAGGAATVARADFVATRRLDFAARTGRSVGILVRPAPASDLTAARLRWRIGRRPSRGGIEGAPGLARLAAELVRRRDGPPGAWELEQENETGRFRLDAGLADHRPWTQGARRDGGQAAA